jgi:2-polyprenyl-6-methoxyphenol hydroxylase-like FAD-dependent oxidoreductase
MLIDATPTDRILQNDIYDITPMSTWSSGRVTLLGDAAHPTTPNMGQGACMAIESSVVLARALFEVNDHASAFRRYERERMPRTSWITATSRKIGSIGQWENPIACALRNALVAIAPDSVTKKQLEQAAGYEV